MYIDAMTGQDLPKEFDLFWDLKTREELYREMCSFRRNLDGLEELCDVHEIPYTNPLKEELNKLKVSNTFYLLGTALVSIAFVLELLFIHV
jgi:hypothetical protein